MRKSLWLAPIFVLALTSGLWASDPVGVYALIDKVVFEPSEGKPQRAQIWGAFALAEAKFGDEYLAPIRGYLYYTLPGEKDEVVQAEWADMKKVAGTGQVIAFGSRYKSSGRVRGGGAPSGSAAFDAAKVSGLVDQMNADQQ